MDKKPVTSRKERRKKWWGENKAGRVLRARPGPGAESTTKPPPAQIQAASSRGFKSKVVPKSQNADRKPQKHLPQSKAKGEVQNVKKFQKKDVQSKPNNKSPEKKSVDQSPMPSPQKSVNSSTENGSQETSVHLPKKYVLFVGNLPYTITKQQVEDHFRKTGGVKTVRIPKERGTDKGKGFAYVEFTSNISHRIALRLHQTTLAGRKINVEFTSAGGKNDKRMEKLKEKNEKLSKFKMPLDNS